MRDITGMGCSDIVGTEWTNQAAIQILRAPVVRAWLVPDYDTTTEICPYSPARNDNRYYIVEWHGDYEERCYHVHARGDTVDTLIHSCSCSCGGKETPYPAPPDMQLPCRHVLLAWGSKSVDRALQVADLCMRGWVALIPVDTADWV